MKKVLFVALALAVGMTGFAQKFDKTAKSITATAQKPSAVKVSESTQAQGIQFNMPEHMVNANRNLDDFEEFQAMTTNYDLQSNSALGNRIAVWPDGTASVVATWDYSGNTSYPDRGAGYNFYDGSSFGEEPSARQEPIKSGWPSITACGDGEILVSHATGTNVYYRPTKGEGDWTLVTNIEEGQWPRVAASGPNDQYVHIVMGSQEQIDGVYHNHIWYARSTDGGQTWGQATEFPADLLDNSMDGMYRNQLGADDYVMATNGNNVAILLGSYTTELFYLISHDNGATWEKQVVLPWAEEGIHAHEYDDYPEGVETAMISSDNSHSIAIDNNGTVHVAFGLFRWRQTDVDHYTYWPAYNYGIVYWNSNYTNEQGGHEIPLIGQWSGDAGCEWGDTLSYSYDIYRIDTLCAVDGHNNLHYFGYIPEEGSYENVIGATWHYRTLGLATMPGISVDDKGNIAIIYSVWSKERVCVGTEFSYRSAYVTVRDYTGEWFDDAINLSEDFIHSYDEAYSITASPKAYDGSFWMMYSADDAQGLYLDKNDNYPDSNGGQLTDNYIYVVKVTPAMEGWGVEEAEAVNPMTAVTVYPNPVVDKLNIRVNASQASTMSINVYNIMGQKVMEDNANIITGDNCTTLNTSSLSSGIYFVTVKANGFENTLKFIVK